MSSTILIVEDNPLNLELATDLLEVAGYTVLGAATAEEGLHLARDLARQSQGTLPHLVLMDMSLPGMDGLTATRQLCADPLTHGIPVIMLTANAMKGDEVRAIEAGCIGYISKPIDTRTFAQVIAAYLHPSA